MLQTFVTEQWNESFSHQQQSHAIQHLEAGQILYFPKLTFTLEPKEQQFLVTDYADPRAKHISYDSQHRKLWGVQNLTDQQHIELKAMMNRYAQRTYQFIQALFPQYQQDIEIARTSFRTVEVSNRKSSYRKNDTLLHIDAFPSAPNQGRRILRVFCNINPNMPRIWHVGEPFGKIMNRFLNKIKKPVPGTAAFLRFLKITKSYRSLYDHYMLHIHNFMKADLSYQQVAKREEIQFEPNSTWVVFSDEIAHAVVKGQYALEQTFYLPISAMQDASNSPLRLLETLLEHKLGR